MSTYKYFNGHTILPNDYNYDTSTRVQDVICTCKNQKAVLKKILNTPPNLTEVVCYPDCPRILFTAFMRQLRDSSDTSPLDDSIIRKYHAHCDKIFENEILPLIQNFTYDINAWMNHLKDLNKQKEMLPFYEKWLTGQRNYEGLNNNTYTLFSKKEKQAKSGGKMPKCRAISACPPNVKWVGGAVCVALEKIFCNKLSGFKINYNGKCAKTWPEIEEVYEKRYAEGYQHTIDIDGSAWDSTQKYHMKYLIIKVYRWLAEHGKIHHVEPDVFVEVMTARYRGLIAKAYIDKRTHIIFNARIDGTTFSGSPDTMLANTVTNLSVISFSMKQCGYLSHQYCKDCSGDDSHISVTELVPNINENITTTWKGLGLIPKYVIVGDYSDITFCSTNVIPYYKNGKMRMKLVRQIDRLAPLSHYSQVALQYSRGQLKQYYLDLALGIEFWAKDMPMYSTYSEAFRHMSSRIPDKIKKIPQGKSKMYFETTEVYDNYIHEKELGVFRTSHHTPPNDVVYDYLLNKFGITRSDIAQHRDTLINLRDYSNIE